MRSFVMLMALVGCGDKSGEGGMEMAEPCSPITVSASVCDHETGSFTLDSTNAFYPLKVGQQVVLEGTVDGVVERVERTVLEETRTVGGVDVHVLEHKNFHDGEIHEIAYNFYVEATDGTVCYFGEDVEYYEGGDIVDTHGTWRVGEGGARPGIIMLADPQVGDTYYQEVAPGSAEDMGQVLSVGGTETIGGQTHDGVLHIVDTNPIDDEEPCHEELKRYVPGIGEVGDVELELVSFTPGR